MSLMGPISCHDALARGDVHDFALTGMETESDAAVLKVHCVQIGLQMSVFEGADQLSSETPGEGCPLGAAQEEMMAKWHQEVPARLD